MHRRFVNLVVDSFVGDKAVFTLHRVDVSGLFISAAGGRSAGAGGGACGGGGAVEDAEDAHRLPPPAMTFYPTGSRTAGNVDFLPLSGSKDEEYVVALGHDGHGLLYGVASGSVHVLPALRRFRGRISPVSLTVGEANSLYVMERRPFFSDPGCFEVLSHGIRPGGWSADDFPRHGRAPGWYWRSLPPPPFARASYHHCHATLGRAGAREYGIAAAACAPGGQELWITAAPGGGTYSFDTRSGAWSKVGDWALPFQGRADYVPEHSLWYGLASSPSPAAAAPSQALPRFTMCASDLMTGASWRWSGLAPPSDQWYPAQESCLLPLGAAMFCVARFFADVSTDMQSCVVFTGVEVIGKEDDHGLLLVRKHQSKRYEFVNDAFVRRFSRVF